MFCREELTTQRQVLSWSLSARKREEDPSWKDLIFQTGEKHPDVEAAARAGSVHGILFQALIDDLYSLDERLANEAWLSGEEVAAGLALVMLGLLDVVVRPPTVSWARETPNSHPNG